MILRCLPNRQVSSSTIRCGFTLFRDRPFFGPPRRRPLERKGAAAAAAAPLFVTRPFKA